jgi:hypothetical protein
MRKFRASMEPFWDLKIGKYVEHLMPVSSEYLISCELPSLTSTAGRTSRVFLAYVIPWINKASFALYIVCSVPCHDRLIWKSEAVLGCRVSLCDWSVSLSSHSRSIVGLRLHHGSAGMLHYARTTLTTFYHMHHYHYAATGDMVTFSYQYNDTGV